MRSVGNENGRCDFGRNTSTEAASPRCPRSQEELSNTRDKENESSLSLCPFLLDPETPGTEDHKKQPIYDLRCLRVHPAMSQS